MIYVRLHILTLVVCFINGITIPTDLFMLLLSYLLFTALDMLLLYAHYLYTRAPFLFFLHTHWVAFR